LRTAPIQPGGARDEPERRRVTTLLMVRTARLSDPVMEYNHAGEPVRFARMAQAFASM